LLPAPHGREDEREREAWLPHGEKISKISLFILAQLTNVTDGQTPHADIYRAYAYAYASRGKNRNYRHNIGHFGDDFTRQMSQPTGKWA